MTDRPSNMQGELGTNSHQLCSLQKQYAYLLHLYCLLTGAQSTSYPGLLGQVKSDCSAVTARGGVSLEWLAQEHEQLAADLQRTQGFNYTSTASEVSSTGTPSQSAKTKLDIDNGNPR